MEDVKILWADDEIDLLKPHILFLKDKGYAVDTATNGEDALDLVERSTYDMVFLDENMPGLSGLETLEKVKALRPATPVIMITKSEEESIMEEAIGSRIADYLIKPVNPRQILTSIKKNLDSGRLVSEKVNHNYQVEFRQIGMRLNDRLDHEDWVELYGKLVKHEIELGQSTDNQMNEILGMQKTEANKVFSDFIEDNYEDWLNGNEEAPVMSHTVFKKWVIPQIKQSDSTFFIVIDNLRYDQWKVLAPEISKYFRVEEEKNFYSILPTATQYARNALFSVLFPSEIQKRFPRYWRNEDEEGSKNQFEAELQEEQLKRNGVKVKAGYYKITNLDQGKKLIDQFSNLTQNEFTTIVYNFVDMLSHARSDMKVIKELADDEAAYRSLTSSWFKHSPLLEMLKLIAEKKAKVIITTDHGTIKVKNPVKVVGDRNTNTNLRYKVGKNLNYDEDEVFEVNRPDNIYLPKLNVSSRYIFAREDDYFVYPNNYNHFVTHFKDTFQHGGISLEEIIVPFVVLNPR